MIETEAYKDVCYCIPIIPEQKGISPIWIGLYDPDDKKYYNNSHKLQCGRKAIIAMAVNWTNCTRAEFVILCGNHGGRYKIIDVTVNLPNRNGRQVVFYFMKSGRQPFTVDELIKACGYECTSKEFCLCGFVKCLS